MKIKLFLFLILLTAATSAFSQEAASENKPKAYLVASIPANRPTENRPQAYLIGSGKPSQSTQPQQAYLYSTSDTNAALTRPRIAAQAKTDASLERQVFALINQQRNKLGLESLVWSDDVAKIARLHSENMANFNFFSHTGIDGLMVNDRADEFGISRWRAIGENIAYNKGFENPVAFAVERWMQSPSHRENLLNSRWKESGIGVAVTNDGTYYFTEVFMVRK